MKKIYTDGACKGNPGVGGWGVAIFENEQLISEKYGYGGNDTTNIRMEMKAIIEGLKLISLGEKATIYTDSQFSINGVTKWLDGWKKKNWKTSKGEDVKNKDLWLEFEQQLVGKEVIWQWVKGHNGNYGNELADKLANIGSSGKTSD